MLTFVRCVYLNRSKIPRECPLYLWNEIELFWEVLFFFSSSFVIIIPLKYNIMNVCLLLAVCSGGGNGNSTKTNNTNSFLLKISNPQNTLLFILELKSAFAFWWHLTFHLCACGMLSFDFVSPYSEWQWWELRKCGLFARTCRSFFLPSIFLSIARVVVVGHGW